MELETSPIGPQLRDMSSKPVERVAAPTVDALIAHWLPGHRASENAGSAGTHFAVRAAASTESSSQNSSLGLRGFTRGADTIGQSAPKADRVKPKKAESKASPLNERTEDEGTESSRDGSMLPTVSSMPQSKAAIGTEDEEPVVAPEPGSDLPDLFGELDGIAIDTAVQLASVGRPVVVHDQALAAICGESEASEVTQSETEPVMWVPNSWIVSTLAAGFAIASLVRHSTLETSPAVANRLRTNPKTSPIPTRSVGKG